MADQIIKCISCHYTLFTVTGIPGHRQLHINVSETETMQLKKLHDGTVVICPKCGGLTQVDEELLKKF